MSGLRSTVLRPTLFGAKCRQIRNNGIFCCMYFVNSLGLWLIKLVMNGMLTFCVDLIFINWHVLQLLNYLAPWLYELSAHHSSV